MLDIKIVGGTVFDGSGAPPRSVDIGICGNTIRELGDLSAVEAHKEIDAAGLVVAPGLIDVHTHSDFSLFLNGRAESTVRQGITTVVTGTCGHGCAPIGDPELVRLNTLGYRSDWPTSLEWRTFGEYVSKLLDQGVSCNVLSLVGHGALRLTVMGFTARVATADELAQMSLLLNDAMEAGAAGLSTGLEYPPGWHADRRELTALVSVVNDWSGLYSTHIRDRASRFVEAVDEALSVGRETGAPVQMSHLAPRPYAPADALDLVLARVDQARAAGQHVGIDTLIDVWGPSSVTCLLPPGFTEAPPDDVLRRLASPEWRQMVAHHLSSPDNYLVQTAGLDQLFFQFAPNSPDVVGVSLAEVAVRWEKPAAEVVCEILLREGRDFYNTVLRHIYAEREAIVRLLRQPYCVPMSDGVATAPYGPLAGYALNRSSYGWTARFLNEYAGSDALFPMEEAIRRMTSLPAKLLGLADRGTIKKGAWADITLLDLDELEDVTTESDPIGYPTGIPYVIVNGHITVADQRHTGERAGGLLRPGGGTAT